MAIEVKLYSFSKKENSTKRPGSGGFVVSGNLNNNTSITAPAISFKADVTITKYNYAYIAEFSRYYKITSWEYVLGLWRASMVVDALASWKPEIGETTAYILRAASNYDANIVDTLYPSTPAAKMLRATGGQPFTSGPYFIVQYYGASGINAVLLTHGEFNSMCAQLWDKWNRTDGMYDVLANAVDPFQFVASVQATPGGTNFWTTGGNANLVLGNLKLAATGAALMGETGRVYSVSVPKHPGSGDRPFLKSSTFSKYSLKLPGVGVIELPADKLYNETTLSVQYEAEPFSGKCRVEIYGTGGLIASATGCVTYPWGIGSNFTGTTAVIGSALSTVGSIASAIHGNFIGAANGIASAAQGLIPTFSQNGGASGAVGFYEEIACMLWYQDVVDDNVTDHGRPLMQERKINTLSGYLITDDAHFSAPATTGEIDIINQALLGGMFYE